MCSPYGRCYADSHSRANSLKARISKHYEKLADNTLKIKKALEDKSFATYERLRTMRERIIGWIRDLKKELRYVQRDIDGTKKGRRLLEDELAAASTPVEVDSIKKRIKQADAMKFQRHYAHQYVVDQRLPLLRISGEALAA